MQPIGCLTKTPPASCSSHRRRAGSTTCCRPPKHQAAKIYLATTKHPVDAAQINSLLAGVLHDDLWCGQAAAEVVGENLLRHLTEGKYHQVKRMVAAAGNRVEACTGPPSAKLTLPLGHAARRGRWLEAADFAKLGPKEKDPTDPYRNALSHRPGAGTPLPAGRRTPATLASPPSRCHQEGRRPTGRRPFERERRRSPHHPRASASSPRPGAY